MYIFKILIIISILSHSLISSDLRINTLGGNVGFWENDDSNWMTFPSSINNVDMVQVAGIGDANLPGTAMIIWGEKTTFAFKYNQGGLSTDDASSWPDWFNIGWGDGTWGVTANFGL